MLDHENGWMQSKENSDIYCTREPQLAFHQRIQFCLDLHNHSVKAMRFPPKNYNQDLESAEDRREREAQDLELAKEMAEEDDDLIFHFFVINKEAEININIMYSQLKPVPFLKF